ncbi:MAG: RNA polymerase sporulation sigma factor SigE [Clostridiales bacterium]|nr:RNA polymerase sporulation sigma factor SigE [Clostridiales bacterium]
MGLFKKLVLKIFKLFDLFKGEKSVDYITSGEALPSPLSPEEEADEVAKFMQGDENARVKLIEHNLRLVVYIAKRFTTSNVDIEDLISVGTIGLIKAVNSFDYQKNIKLATYASRCIENEILMHLRKVVKMKQEVSLDEPLNVDWEGNMLLLSDVLGTDNDAIYRNIETSAEKEMLKETFEKLPEREREIVEMRFGLHGREEKTQKEIAEMMGISQSYISRLEKKIVGKLKKEISKLV